MIADVRPSVVRISTDYASGSGVIFEVDDNGALVLTNFHVIRGAIEAEVETDDSSTYDAEILGRDSVRDLAVLRICCGDFRALPFGNVSELNAGDEIFALGYALGLEGEATVTRGIVSAIRYDEDQMSFLIQTDAALNPGNSGGPMLSSTGEILGINTFGYRETRSGVNLEGLGFAVAASTIGEQLDILKSPPPQTSVEELKSLLLSKINQERRLARVHPLTPAITSVGAQGHAEHLRSEGYLSHYDLDGNLATQRAAKLGYYGGVVENVSGHSCAFLERPPQTYETVDEAILEAFREMFRSPSYKYEMLHRFWDTVDIGISCDGTVCWTVTVLLNTAVEWSQPVEATADGDIIMTVRVDRDRVIARPQWGIVYWDPLPRPYSKEILTHTGIATQGWKIVRVFHPNKRWAGLQSNPIGDTDWTIHPSEVDPEAGPDCVVKPWQGSGTLHKSYTYLHGEFVLQGTDGSWEIYDLSFNMSGGFRDFGSGIYTLRLVDSSGNFLGLSSFEFVDDSDTTDAPSE